MEAQGNFATRGTTHPKTDCKVSWDILLQHSPVHLRFHNVLVYYPHSNWPWNKSYSKFLDLFQRSMSSSRITLLAFPFVLEHPI